MNESCLRQKALASAYEYAKKYRYEGNVAEAFVMLLLKVSSGDIKKYKEDGMRVAKNPLKVIRMLV